MSSKSVLGRDVIYAKTHAGVWAAEVGDLGNTFDKVGSTGKAKPLEMYIVEGGLIVQVKNQKNVLCDVFIPSANIIACTLAPSEPPTPKVIPLKGK